MTLGLMHTGIKGRKMGKERRRNNNKKVPLGWDSSFHEDGRGGPETVFVGVVG